MSIKLPKLNFPTSNFKLKEENGKLFIFDPVRRKYIQLTPEEWVRQNCLHYLRDTKGYPVNLLSVERGFKLNNRSLRYDLVAYSKKAKPLLLVECKAPEVKITQETFNQIAAYNLELNVPFLMITNGLQHYICMADFEKKCFQFLNEVPMFNDANFEFR